MIGSYLFTNFGNPRGVRLPNAHLEGRRKLSSLSFGGAGKKRRWHQ